MSPIPWRKVAAAAIVAAGFCCVAALYSLGLTDANAASRDYIGYWAAGQQLAHDANPYDFAAVLHMEQAVGLGQQEIKITPSPPPGLALVLPLGFLSPRHGLLLWLLLQLAALSLSLWLLWRLHGSPPTRVHLFGYLFAPALACLMAGQLGLFFLLGVSVFLCVHTTRPFWAGVALLPCALKPHLFLPVAIALVLWSLHRRAPRVLAGFLLAAGAGCAVVMALDPHIWAQYFAMTHAADLRDRFAPTLSAYLRMQAAPHTVWVQYVPLAGACAWAAWYFWSRRAQWSWLDQGTCILLVALLCAPYAWFTDESVLLPAVLTALYRLRHCGRSMLPVALAAAAALVELLAGLRITAWYFLWTTPAWLACFLYAMRKSNAAPESPGAASLPLV